MSLIERADFAKEYKCDFDECKNQQKFSQRQFKKHLRKKHNLTIEQHAWKFKTAEIVKCCICERETYVQPNKQKKTCCRSCANKKSISTRRNRGTLNEENRRSTKKGVETRNRNGSYHTGAKKAAETKRTEGTANKIYKKIHQTKIRNGTDKNCNSHQSRLKCHETKKKNGTYGKSNSELAFAWFLNLKFDEVQHQVITNKLEIELKSYYSLDFVVENIMISFDGIYYHGLDRTITEIANCKTSTDRTIFNTFYRDRSFEEACQRNNLNLIRISDHNFGLFVSGKEKLNPYFVCGNSQQLDVFWRKLTGEGLYEE